MINEQLIEYIKQQIAQGVDVSVIRNSLITEGGWTPVNVDEALVSLGLAQAPVSINGSSINGTPKSQVPSSPFQTMQTYANQAVKPKLPRFYNIPYTLASVMVGMFAGLCFASTYFLTAIFGSIPTPLSFIATYGTIFGIILAILFVVFLVGSIGLSFYKDWARKITLVFSVLILVSLYGSVYEGYVTQNIFSIVLFDAMFVHLLCGPKTVAGFKKREVRPLNKKLCYSLIAVLVILFAVLAIIHKPSVGMSVTSSSQMSPVVNAGADMASPVSGEKESNVSNNASMSVSANSSSSASNSSVYPPFKAQLKGGDLSVADRNAIIDANMKFVGVLQRGDVAEFRKYAAIATPSGASAADIAKFNSMPDNQISMLMNLMAPIFISKITPAALSSSAATWTVIDSSHINITVNSKDGNTNIQALKINGVWY